MSDVSAVKALVFDVFGTVVDWRTSVASQVEELARRKGRRVDGAAFAFPAIGDILAPFLPGTKLPSRKARLQSNLARVSR